MSVGGNRWRLRLLAAALLAVSCAKGVESEEEEGAVDADRDDATARRKAMDEWYNEAHPESRDGRAGGMWSPEYRRFMLTAAAKERDRWADRLPGTGFRPLVTGQNWVNIGPNKADFLHNGSF